MSHSVFCRQTARSHLKIIRLIGSRRRRRPLDVNCIFSSRRQTFVFHKKRLFAYLILSDFQRFPFSNENEKKIIFNEKDCCTRIE